MGNYNEVTMVGQTPEVSKMSQAIALHSGYPW